jgi:hypothetical protein
VFDASIDNGTEKAPDDQAGASRRPVAAEHSQAPFPLTGRLDKLSLTINRPQLTPEDEKKLMQAQRNIRASE